MGCHGPSKVRIGNLGNGLGQVRLYGLQVRLVLDKDFKHFFSKGTGGGECLDEPCILGYFPHPKPQFPPVGGWGCWKSIGVICC